jgi:hypothetical protein
LPKQLILAFYWLGAGMIISFLFNLGVMHDVFGIEPKYLLYINVALTLAMYPGLMIAQRFGRDIVVEDTFKTAWKVLPRWLFVGLVAVLIYCVLVFVRFTYVDPPLADKTDMNRVVRKFNLGGTAATLFFYTAQFGLLNLHWRVKQMMDVEDAAQADNSEDMNQ